LKRSGANVVLHDHRAKSRLDTVHLKGREQTVGVSLALSWPEKHPDQPRGLRRRGMLRARRTCTDSESAFHVAG
jgi:hypothetical protein